MAAAMLADSGDEAAFYCFYRPGTQVQAPSPRLCGEANCLPVSEALRIGFGASEGRSVDLLVVPEIDFPFGMPALSVAMLLPAVFGLARILRFVAPSNRQLFGNHNQSAHEHPWEVR